MDVAQETLPSSPIALTPVVAIEPAVPALPPKKRSRATKRKLEPRCLFDDTETRDAKENQPLVVVVPEADVTVATEGAVEAEGAVESLGKHMQSVVEMNPYYYKSSDYRKPKVYMDHLRGYGVMYVYKTVFCIEEPAESPFTLIHNMVYPNGLYFALIVCIMDDIVNEVRDIIIPGSLKPYGNKDMNIDIVYKCICDMEVCSLLGSALCMENENTNRLPYPGQRIYLKVTVQNVKYDRLTEKIIFV
ncbi:hypothetical protein V9T40_007010 [Parthenolecanium corni]|uniref:Uncharacterized protein n=1 Tax=Parthenolecanium corni TaxID=536013 RepID=A0AAN9TUI2_9HEMI